MAAAAAACRAGQVVRAERDWDPDVEPVREAEWLGLIDDNVAVRADGLSAAAAELARLLAGDDAEIVTLIAGADVSEQETARVDRAVRAALPDAEVEVIRGDQPRFPFLVGAE
jgi:dihydroxyacetone kinase-like predicted kinase